MQARISFAAILVSLGVACTDVPGTPEVALSVRDLRSTVWVRGGVRPEALFPAWVDHLHTNLTPATEREFYAWGIAAGEVLWIYKVDLSDMDDFTKILTLAWRDQSVAGSSRSYSIAGTVKGPKIPDPSPVGEPEFSGRYVAIVMSAAQQHEDLSQATIDQISALP